MNAAAAKAQWPGRIADWAVLAGPIGLLAAPAAWWALQPYQFNVITYELIRAEFRPVPTVAAFSVLVFLLPPLLAGWSALGAESSKLKRFLSCAAPLVAMTPLAAHVYLDGPPPFWALILSMAGAGASAWLAGRNKGVNKPSRAGLAWGSLLLAIAALTVVHTHIQQNFFEHFMLGHADIGHFTEELKNALAGRGLRSDSFENTRLGWHFVPLMYVLVPGYALWPSIVYLMVLGPLVLHLGALPVFWFVRQAAGSVLVAWVFAVAWLLLPSLSRLVYSNTYGFAWLYTSVPVLCVLVGALLLRRWMLCWVLVAVLFLSRETHTAVTLGLGIYLSMFSRHRAMGGILIVVSIAYGLLCAEVIIPYFAKAGRYERLSVFGELGGSLPELAMSVFRKPDAVIGRLTRTENLQFLMILLASMAFLPLRNWRLLGAALPALAAHLLMENPQWVSIKFWHHAMVIPILFFAGLNAARGQPAEEDTAPLSDHQTGECKIHRNLGPALALLTCAAMGHYFFGFSPLSKSYEPYANDPFLQSPDPRLDVVQRLRAEIPRSKTVLASERMAAHFTDYGRLYTGKRIRPADFVIVDVSDSWDTSGLPQRVAEFQSNPEYRLYFKESPIVVFERVSPDASQPED